MRLPRQQSLWWPDGRPKLFFVYIMSNASMSLYTGVTNDLVVRAARHAEGEGSTFTARYHFDRLVYFECYELASQAFQREKQIKGWTRKRKIALVKALNPQWRNLLTRTPPPASS